MQVTETKNDGLRREFLILVDAKDVENRMAGRLNQLSMQVNMPGFRPGRVPVPLLRQRYGSSLMSEVLEEAVSMASQATIAERSLRLAMQPKVEIKKFGEGQDLEYTLAVELLPEFDPGDFSTIHVERFVAEPGQTDIDEAIDRLVKAQRTFGPAPEGYAAVKGDLTTIDFVGRIDGEKFDGGAGEDHRLEIGSGQFIPGFEEQIIGAKVGDERKVTVTFPADYGVPYLAGREAVFDVKVKGINAPEETKAERLPERLGLENLDAVRDAVKGQLAKDFDAISKRRLKRAILDELSKRHSFGVPQGLVDSEFDAIWRQVEEARKQGESDPGDANKTEEELKTTYRDIAERRVRLGLLLAEIGQRNNIQVSSEELERAITEQAMRFPGQERAVFDFYRKNAGAVEQLRAPILEDKVVNFIAEIAKVAEKVVSSKELITESDEPIGAA